ncbi:deoxyribose-phosphate aldolase [Candidatus Contubernalis alkaliaceticus]|uniref:deoxyribose-phosphate aldolase n=1 Tax=Candidatus Contubernalis alkaliaceticus TaxID=338645 RepID=UPI001F4C28E7|nr:deoxyribose-phosphate aldolase [Candidatus Contubernalis alkalaceticus]UNC92435.1 deoxyribose-phosphate aldolase [Candidatus Contubernalis alkalaceticus]
MDFRIASFIDHTLLKPQATQGDILTLCDQAVKYGFAAVCINSKHVELAVNRLKGTPVRIAVVVGFPLGAGFSEVKAFEAKMAVEKGAQEIDMVADIGALKEGNFSRVGKDIGEVVMAAFPAEVKVIVETALLTKKEKEKICRIVMDSGAAYIKTSTGFVPEGGALLEDVLTFKKIVKDKIKIKASGGIKSLAFAQKLLDSGAERLGTSSSISIIEEENEKISK